MSRKTVIAFTLVASTLGWAAPAALAQRPSGEAVHHYVEGRRYLEAGHLEAAEAELEEAVRLDPDYLDALSTLALVYFKQGKLTHYRAVLQRAVEVKARQGAPPPERPRPELVPPQAPGEPPLEPPSAEPPPQVAGPPQESPRQEPEPTDVFILESRGKRGPLGQLRIDGRLKNNTARTVQRVEVALVAYSAGGRPIDPPVTYRGPWELRPGEMAPFSIDVADQDNAVERFDLKPSWEPVPK